MLTITDLEGYTARAKNALNAINRAEVCVVKDNLVNFLQDHKKEQNIFMISLVPEHGMSGGSGWAKWDNTCAFFFLIKTDYSKLKHTDYLQIFKDTRKWLQHLLTWYLMIRPIITAAACLPGLMREVSRQSP